MSKVMKLMVCKKSCVVGVLSVALMFAVSLTGCGGPNRIKPPKINASAAAKEAMKMYDTNQDGKISGDEFGRCSALKAIAKDGVVTPEMIAEQCTKWTKGDCGRVPGCIRILHNGKPLVGASVKLVPEKFLGKDIATVTAVSEANGFVPVTVPSTYPGEPRGISVGFYRVEVTKDGENIPAMYNTETILSLPVLGDVLSGVPFDLKY
jgi:hypothetical protein